MNKRSLENIAEALIRFRAADGDMEAIEMLYMSEYDLMLNFGLKYCYDPEFVKDCIQDVFVKLILKPKALRKVKYTRTYLLVSLRNIMYDKLKDKTPVDSFEDLAFKDMIENLEEEMETGRRSDEEAEIYRQLSVAYNQLTGNQRMALYLRFVKGFSHKELAEYMEMNVQSSRNLLSRALTKLRKLMGDSFLLLMII